MTLMLASVRDLCEAEIALAEGADIIDLDASARTAGAPAGSFDLDACFARLAGRRRFSALRCDLPMDEDLFVETAKRLAASGVDFIRLGFSPSEATAACIAALAPVAAHVKLIAVCFVDIGADLAWLPLFGKAGFAGAMLDTAAKSKLRLVDHMTISDLDRFIEACRANKLMAGLAGSLEAPDVARLLLLEPDVLGFRAALCADQDRGGRLVASNVKLVRDLIPRSDAEPSDEANVDWRFLAARNTSADDATDPATDRVFVHDLVIPVSIGAYDFERGVPQKVRFNIDVDVKRAARQAEDMRDVFSYDVIVDAIRLILSRGHIALVETLAEQIADALLAHSRVVSVQIRVEKLDVVEGRVGVELRRHRAAQAPATRRQPAPVADIGVLKTGV